MQAYSQARADHEQAMILAKFDEATAADALERMQTFARDKRAAIADHVKQQIAQRAEAFKEWATREGLRLEGLRAQPEWVRTFDSFKARGLSDEDARRQTDDLLGVTLGREKVTTEQARREEMARASKRADEDLNIRRNLAGYRGREVSLKEMLGGHSMTVQDKQVGIQERRLQESIAARQERGRNAAAAQMSSTNKKVRAHVAINKLTQERSWLVNQLEDAKAKAELGTAQDLYSVMRYSARDKDGNLSASSHDSGVYLQATAKERRYRARIAEIDSRITAYKKGIFPEDFAAMDPTAGAGGMGIRPSLSGQIGK